MIGALDRQAGLQVSSRRDLRGMPSLRVLEAEEPVGCSEAAAVVCRRYKCWTP